MPYTFGQTNPPLQGRGGGFTFDSSGGAVIPMSPVTPIPQQGDKDRIRRSILAVETGHGDPWSQGDPYGISPSGGHFGVYQMGHARAADVGIPNARALLGNAELAEWAFWKSLARSEKTHMWRPELVAISWKAGTSTLKKFLEMVADGMPYETALDRLPWNTGEYVARFRRAYEKAA